MGREKQSEEHSDTAQPGDAVRATIDQLEAAERELEIAEQARRARADEVAMAAEAVEASIGQAIDAEAAERDDLRERLHASEQRLRELEAARSKARLQRISRTTTGASSQLAEPKEDQPANHSGSADQEDKSATVGDPATAPVPEGGESYEDGWYEVLKRQEAEADGDAV